MANNAIGYFGYLHLPAAQQLLLLYSSSGQMYVVQYFCIPLFSVFIKIYLLVLEYRQQSLFTSAVTFYYFIPFLSLAEAQQRQQLFQSHTTAMQFMLKNNRL